MLPLGNRFLPFVVLACVAGCSEDTVTGPNPPEQARPTVGQIAVSVASNRSGYELSFTIDGAGSWTVRPNDDVRVTGLQPGEYRVNLGIPTGLECTVRQGSERIAQVRAGETTSVQYQVDCGSVPERPRERESR